MATNINDLLRFTSHLRAAALTIYGLWQNEMETPLQNLIGFAVQMLFTSGLCKHEMIVER